MPVGAVWAWPSQRVSAADAEIAMIAHSERLAQVARKYAGVGTRSKSPTSYRTSTPRKRPR